MNLQSSGDLISNKCEPFKYWSKIYTVEKFTKVLSLFLWASLIILRGQLEMPPLLLFPFFKQIIDEVSLICIVAKLPQVSQYGIYVNLLSGEKVIYASAWYFNLILRCRRQKKGESFETRLDSPSIYLFTMGYSLLWLLKILLTSEVHKSSTLLFSVVNSGLSVVELYHWAHRL